mgnify:CR=1 FL=1
MRLIKRMAAGLAAALLLGVLSGCGGRQGENIVFDSALEDAGSETHLTFFGFKYEALNVMAIEDALHRYMDTYPEVSISYDGIKSPAYFDVLEKRLATGNEDDVFMVDHERVLELGNQGKLADLSGLSTLDSFSELAKSQMNADGKVYYVPTSISAFGLYCNLDLLKQHGQTVPETLPELQAVCDYFVSEGIIPIVANNDISLKTVAIAKAMLPIYQSGHTAEDIARFNSGQADLAQALRPGFALVEQMLDQGWIDADEALQTAKTKDDLALFAKGDRPFMLTGAWAVSRLRDLEPGFQFEVRPYPILEDGSVLVINVDTRISVNADSPNVEQAKQFAEFMTQKDVMWEFVESQSSFSPLEENRLAKDKAIQSIGPYLNNGRSVLGSDDNLHFPIWDMTRQCVVELLEGGDADSATTLLDAQIAKWIHTEGDGAE